MNAQRKHELVVDSEPGVDLYGPPMSDLVPTLRRELASTEADVSKLEAEATKLQARLRSSLDKADKLKALLAIYTAEEVTPDQPKLFESAGWVADPQTNLGVGSEHKRVSKAARIRSEIIDLLSARGTEHRQKILDHLVSKGLMGHESTPMASLAAYLSTNKDYFVPDGRGNFSLRREGNRETLPAPEVGAGSAEERDTRTPAIHNAFAMKGEVS